MPIKFRCVHCGQYLGISHSKAGTIVDCPTCGRSVGVPQKDGQAERVGRPSLNHEDSQLAEALREVASIAQSSEAAMPQPPREPSHSTDARETREVHAPPPKIVPAAPLPPAEPVDHESASILPPPEAFSDEDLEGDEEETYYERVPFKSLASLAAEPDDDDAVAASPSEPAGYGQFQWTNEIPWKLWSAFIAVGFVAILAGFALGRWDLTSKPAERSPETKGNETTSANEPAPAAIDPHADLLAQFGEVAFTGTVKYAAGERSQVQADAGAWIYAFPLERNGGEKIPADWLQATKPADYGTDHALAVAALRVMGGNAVQAGKDGKFKLRLAQKGKYHLLVCSHEILRLPDQPPSKKIVQMLAGFFQDPNAFLDRRQYFYTTKEYQEADTKIQVDTLAPIPTDK